MKGLAIINPSSGKQSIQHAATDAIDRILQRGIAEEITIYYTHKKDDAENRAAIIKEGEYGFVMAVGGDGTVNEVVNGLVRSGTKTPLVIIGAGTTNDFASANKLPTYPEDVAKMVEKMNTIDVDVGKVNDKYFLNVAAGGLLSEVAHKVTPDLKTSFGKLAYYIAGVKDLSSLKLDTVPLRFELEDGTVFEEDTFLFVVANTRSVGGFANICPDAKVNDGVLDVCIIKKLNPIDVLPLGIKIQVGSHVNDSHVIYFQSPSVKITRAGEAVDVEDFPVDYDGENGGTIPVTVSTLRAGIKLVVPPCKDE